MSETILNALVRLFAIIGDIHEETVITSRGKDIVRTFLLRHLNNALVTKYMKTFEEYLGIYNSESIRKGSIEDRKRVSLNATRILAICEKINEELHQNQKVYVLIQLMDFISLGEEITENELDFLQTVADSFNVPSTEYKNIRTFIMNNVYDVHEKHRVLVLDNKKRSGSHEIKHIYDEYLRGKIAFLYIPSTNTYILRYEGDEDLYLNGQNIFAGQTYIFDRGSTIRGSGIKTIYYSEVSSYISEASFKTRIFVDAENVTFRFSNSENGIQNLNFHGESGELIGIIGGSGVGKSTTLSILNGTLKPQKGKVLINGYNLYDEIEKQNLKGVLGFVPQDDLLIEDLTVYQNIYYNAKMCLNNLAENEIVEIVNKTLVDFDLDEVQDLKVGNPLKKIISGGQRKRVNIALELLREPTILFVDEPTSGLSSVDSEAVMNLLKEQTHKGKLVIINIHQPASEIYKMFNKVMIIDRGGYQVWFGNPTEAIVYFKTVTRHANPDEDQCVKCGNVNTDQILQIIEAKVVNEHGKPTRTRKITPGEWAEKFRGKSPAQPPRRITERQTLPENNFSIPGLLKQSKIFFTRDLLSKLADKQYLVISLLGSPLLSVILAYFTRYASGDVYKFSENENITPYLFMCVITSLFFGLMVSSEEIVKDRKILKRESFLNLSWFSYLNSKIMILFLISLIQTISFVVIGNLILGIRGMTLSYWLVLFTTSCFANILGLNISSAFDSVIAIYIIIPFIIIPQLLFSGVLVKYDKLHLAGNPVREYVPVIGDLMTARWSFEALAVEQFKNNDYQRHFFKYKMEESRYDWYATLVDQLNYDLWEIGRYKNQPGLQDNIGGNYYKINTYIDELSPIAKYPPGNWKNDINPGNFSKETEDDARRYLDSLKRIFVGFKKAAIAKSDFVMDSLKKVLGEDGLVELQDKYKNNWLSDLVLGYKDLGAKMFIETDNKIIQKWQPAYMKATSKYGRSHFYAPVKRLGNLEIDTYLFNIIIIWIESLFLYTALYFKLLRRLIDYLGDLHIFQPLPDNFRT